MVGDHSGENRGDELTNPSICSSLSGLQLMQSGPRRSQLFKTATGLTQQLTITIR